MAWGDKKIRLGCLTKEEAWVLFKEKVRGQALCCHPQKVGALPLALITVERAMASKKTCNEWSYTLNVLK